MRYISKRRIQFFSSHTRFYGLSGLSTKGWIEMRIHRAVILFLRQGMKMLAYDPY